MHPNHDKLTDSHQTITKRMQRNGYTVLDFSEEEYRALTRLTTLQKKNPN